MFEQDYAVLISNSNFNNILSTFKLKYINGIKPRYSGVSKEF